MEPRGGIGLVHSRIPFIGIPVSVRVHRGSRIVRKCIVGIRNTVHVAVRNIRRTGNQQGVIAVIEPPFAVRHAYVHFESSRNGHSPQHPLHPIDAEPFGTRHQMPDQRIPGVRIRCLEKDRIHLPFHGLVRGYGGDDRRIVDAQNEN